MIDAAMVEIFSSNSTVDYLTGERFEASDTVRSERGAYIAGRIVRHRQYGVMRRGVRQQSGERRNGVKKGLEVAQVV